MARPVALLDANVLYPARLRDLLIRLDIAGLYQARWSEQILDECFENLAKKRPDLADGRLDRTREHMKAALPDAIVADYEDLIDEQDLPDPDDHHVLAAAIKAGATHLVTNNLDDFPAEKVPEGLVVVSADAFVIGLADEDTETVLGVVEMQAGQLRNPPMTTPELLDGLEEVDLVEFVRRVHRALS
jgi:predicted nucleic acid-binding protein